jgi:hypothetical protein
MQELHFPSRGLHLAVIGALLDDEALSQGALAEYLRGINPEPGRQTTDLEEEGRRIEAALRRLHALSLPRSSVASIEKLDFDGGNPVYLWLEGVIGVYTGGEDDDYRLDSLAGIDQLKALTELDLDGYGYRESDLDLAPLAAHPSLSSLVLSGHCTRATSLETLPKLAKLDLRLGSLDDPSVIDRLATRGVAIKR